MIVRGRGEPPRRHALRDPWRFRSSRRTAWRAAAHAPTRAGGAGADRARRRGRAATALMVHSVDLALIAAASSNPVGEEGRARPDHAPGDRPSRDATPASRECRTGGGSPLDTADRATTPAPRAELPPERGHLPRRNPRPTPVHAPPAGDRAANGGSRRGAAGRVARPGGRVRGRRRSLSPTLARRGPERCIRRGERPDRPAQPLVPGRVAAADGSTTRRLRPRKRL